MSSIYKTEIIRNTALTRESSLVTCNYSNALIAFKGNSVLITERIQNREYRNFLRLKNRWKFETRFFSNSNEIINNSAYKSIIGMGKKTIPWIIRDLKKSNNHWFFALKEITGINPVNPENYGKINDMKNDWIVWAEKNNYE